MGNSRRKVFVILLIAFFIVGSNLAAAITTAGERHDIVPQPNLPQLTGMNYVCAHSSTEDFDWSANAPTAYTEGAKQVEIIVGVDRNLQKQREIASYATKNGGFVATTLSLGSKGAVVVSVPTTAVSSFVNNVRESGLSRYVEVNGEYHVYSMPNDPYWDRQWGTQRISADYAWNTTVGNSDVVVAVIDTGIDYTHPDLARCYIGGYDFVNNDPYPLDDHGHGTHCAGTIAATMNNGIGIAGVAQVKIMALKGLSE